MCAGLGTAQIICTLCNRWLMPHAGSRWWAALVGLLMGMGWARA